MDLASPNDRRRYSLLPAEISRKGGYDAKRTNGIVNLNVTFPDSGTYNVHVVYVYNCTIGFSKGSAELIF